ncbi:hypothetical protein [Rhizobium sp. BR 362]|uniref:hypothetical protein n=1 Tax=Rhizobium sp. BR 362 TaxID=3040670 RepID=UPI002F42D560
MLSSIACWLEKVDPGCHRRIKGIRLVTAFGIAALAGAHYASTYSVPKGNALGVLAAGFALWSSVLEARPTRRESTRDLLLLAVAAVSGAIVTAATVPTVNSGCRPVVAMSSRMGRLGRRIRASGLL